MRLAQAILRPLGHPARSSHQLGFLSSRLGRRGFATDQFFTTNDEVKLRFTDSGGDGYPLVFLHGWTANGRWFNKNIDFLSSKGLRVITMDYRGMGDSDKPGHGARVARISTDVKCLVDELELKDAVFCGTSMGFTVISLYYELYGKHRLKGACFVDQTAAQYIKPTWELGSLGLCTREMVGVLKSELKFDPQGFGRGVASSGFGVKPPTEEEYAWFLKEYLKCDLEFCGRLMEDHANLDLRDLIPHMKLPILNLIGGSTKCHNIEGMKYIGENAPNGLNKIYPKYGHWLYWEDPDNFNQDILHFVNYVNSNANDTENGALMENF